MDLRNTVYTSIAVGIGFTIGITAANGIELDKVSTGTTVYSYEGADGDVIAETQFPFIFKVSQPFDNHEFSFVSNGRLRKDFGADYDFQGKLYYGYLQYDGFDKIVRTRLGRQYISDGAATGTIDGISLNFGQSKKWNANISAGGKVGNRFGTFDYGESRENLLYSAHAGFALPLIPFDVWLAAGFSGTKTNDITDTQTISFEAKEKPFKNLALNQELHWDYIKGEISYQKYALRFKPIKPLKLYATFRYNEPTISNASILYVFASDANQVLRAGGEYGVNDWLSVSSEYTTTFKQLNTSNRLKFGASNYFDFFSAYYGGMYGKATDTYYGAFLNAEFPQPCSFLKGLGVGATTHYTRYIIEDLPEDVYEDTLTFDLHGDYKIHKILGTTFGMQTLRNRTRKYDFRGYVKVDLTI